MSNIAPDLAATQDRLRLMQSYSEGVDNYYNLIGAINSLLSRLLPSRAVVATTHRLKKFDSFFEKANRIENGSLKYSDPFIQITDVVGFRVVVLARRHVNEVCEILRKNLEIREEEDKADTLLTEGRLGYESYHLIATLGPTRSALGEYASICEIPFELQVRTALQHAWAENEHRIQYKRSKNPELVKRFLRLAAAVSSADEEFDRIYEIDEKLKNEVAEAVEATQPSAEEEKTAAALDNDNVLAEISRTFGEKPQELVRQGRYVEAIQVYDRFVTRQPDQATHFVGRARAKALSGDLEAALDDIATAEALAPNHPAVRKIRKFFEQFID